MNSKILILFVILLSSTHQSWVITGNAETNQETPDKLWHEFKLQKCGRPSITLYDNQTSDNQEFTLKIIVQNLTGYSLAVGSVKNIGSNNFWSESFKVEKVGTSEFTFESVNFGLGISTLGNKEEVHTIISNGQYSINGGELKNFTITACYPDRVKLFQDYNYIHYLSVNLIIDQINVSEMDLSYSYSDYGIQEQINNTGHYSYDFNATHVSLKIYEDGFVSGSYQIISNGFETRPASGFQLFSLLVLFPILFIYRKFKIEKR